MRRRLKKTTEGRIPMDEKCPDCGLETRFDAEVCPYCGRGLHIKKKNTYPRRRKNKV